MPAGAGAGVPPEAWGSMGGGCIIGAGSGRGYGIAGLYRERGSIQGARLSIGTGPRGEALHEALHEAVHEGAAAGEGARCASRAALAR